MIFYKKKNIYNCHSFFCHWKDCSYKHAYIRYTLTRVNESTHLLTNDCCAFDKLLFFSLMLLK